MLFRSSYLPAKRYAAVDQEGNGIVAPHIKEFFAGDVLRIGKEFQVWPQAVLHIGIQQEITIEQDIFFQIATHIITAADIFSRNGNERPVFNLVAKRKVRIVFRTAQQVVVGGV